MAMNKQPVRIFEGTAKPYEPFWRLVDSAGSESSEPEIEMYGPISEFSWFGDEITPAKFKEDLNKLGKGGPVTVRINSPGGEVFAASVIRSILMEYPGRITTRIDGLCASAATFVAMAGNVVRMQDSAFFMIHEPWTLAMGGVDDLKQVIEMLKTVNDGIIETYQSKTKMDYAKLSKMMHDETWMTAKEAKELGFVDEVITAGKKLQQTASAGMLNCLKSYVNLPDSLRSLFQEQEETPDDPKTNPTADRLRAEAKLYVRE